MALDTKGKISVQLILVIICSTIIGVIIGLAVSQYMPRNTTIEVGQSTTNNTTLNEAIFTDQSALINAKVTKISPDSVTVQNINQAEATFSLNDQINISKQTTSGKTATKATAVDIKVGEFIILNLKKINGQYQLQSIVIPPSIGNPPSPPALSTPKPTGTKN